MPSLRYLIQDTAEEGKEKIEEQAEYKPELSGIWTHNLRIKYHVLYDCATAALSISWNFISTFICLQAIY